MNHRLCWLMACLTAPIATFANPAENATAIEHTARGLGTQSSEAEALHVLNRLGYGPRPGEVQQVAKEGVDSWIKRQLDPTSIPDPAVDAVIARLGTLSIPCSTLANALREEAILRKERQRKEGETRASPISGPRPPPVPERPTLLLETALAQQQEAKLIRAVLSERQLNEVLVDFWFNHFNVYARKDLVRAMVESYERDVIRPHIWGSFRDLLEASAKSPAMLVYLDNWQSRRARPARARSAAVAQGASRGPNENYARELMELHTLGVDGGYTQKDVQEVARCFTGWTINRADGSFRFMPAWHDDGSKIVLGHRIPAGGGIQDGERVLDLVASSPATARFISRELCQRFIADDPPEALVERVAATFLASGGSLREVYRCLFESPEFLDPRYAANKIKSPFEFVASAIRAAGASLEPVVPNPPLQQDAVSQARRPAYYLNRTVLAQLTQMGQPPYLCLPPTGFPEDSSRWVSAGALVQRLNFSLALASHRFRDAQPPLRRLVAGAQLDSPESVIDTLDRNLLGSTLTAPTKKVLLAETARAAHGANPVPDIPRLVALIIGSPEFQRR